MTYEGLRLKILKFKRKYFAKYREKKLTNKDFTIISNNCWGGMVYENYNLPKNSPTIGLYFFADDYIKFISDLKKYTEKEITFIKPSESKWKDKFQNDKKIGTYPIGKIEDIEIFFLHYHSEDEVISKWNRRCSRINWNNLIIKFNDQNYCSLKNIEDFYKLNFKNKLFFTVKDWNIKENYIKIKQFGNKDFIKTSYEPFGVIKNFDLNKYINNLERENE